MCAGMWESGIKAKHMGFTRPLYYQTIEGFVRADDTRFDGNVRAANAPAVTLAVLDNDASGFIAASDFPQAKLMPLSHMQGDAELLMSVASGKADMTFTAPGLFRSFDKANPGKLKPAAKGSHLRAFGGAITVRTDDTRLRHMLDIAIAEAMGSGAVDRILATWNASYPEMFVPVARGF